MRIPTVFFALPALWLAIGCKTIARIPEKLQQPPMISDTFALGHSPDDSPLMLQILNNLPAEVQPVIRYPDRYRLQVIYTQIDRDSINRPYFRHHYFNVSDDYIYPASLVKFPAAVLALEKLNLLGIDGLGINTSMYTEPLRPGEKPVFEDKTSPSGKPSVGHYIKKILLVSDNEAHNRLYEFLGQEFFNSRLNQLGFNQAQMTHRLSMALSDMENRTANAVWFMGINGQTLHRQPVSISKAAFAQRNDLIGRGYVKSGAPGEADSVVQEPMDFSHKNRWPLKNAHLLTQWVMFPESQPEQNRLLLAASDYSFLWKYMSMLPEESAFPQYPTKDYWPSYVKFLWAGSEKGAWPNPEVRIFNKVGNAYGFLLDAAYFVDFGSKVEFILSAAIYCNEDEILNDDRYDYEKIGFPFMKALGQAVYDYEKNRSRRFIPDLSTFRIKYTD